MSGHLQKPLLVNDYKCLGDLKDGSEDFSLQRKPEGKCEFLVVLWEP